MLRQLARRVSVRAISTSVTPLAEGAAKGPEGARLRSPKASCPRACAPCTAPPLARLPQCAARAASRVQEAPGAARVLDARAAKLSERVHKGPEEGEGGRSRAGGDAVQGHAQLLPAV